MDKTEYDRIRWASRRGMLELDLLLLPFAETRLAQLDAREREEYGRLLERPDQMLHAWLTGREPPPPEHDAAVRRVRDYIASIQGASVRRGSAREGATGAAADGEGAKEIEE